MNLKPRMRFSTAYETNCVVMTEPDDEGNFEAMDSDGIPCHYTTDMITRIDEAFNEV